MKILFQSQDLWDFVENGYDEFETIEKEKLCEA